MQKLRKNIINSFGDDGAQWIESLSAQVEKYSSYWGLKNLMPVHDLSFNYVLYGTQDDEPVVLKIGYVNKDIEKEALTIKSFGKDSSVVVIDQWEHALLLRRAVPGRCLQKVDGVHIACELMERLYVNQNYNSNQFPLFIDQLTILDQDWNLSEEFILKAREIKNDLKCSQRGNVLLHGDLHHGNIIYDASLGGWIAIDPKGIIGDPIHEAWAFVVDIELDTLFIANHFGWELLELRESYFLNVIIQACQCIANKSDPQFFLNLASKAYALI